MKEEGLPVKAGFYLALLDKTDMPDRILSFSAEMAIVEVRLWCGKPFFMHCDGLTNKKIRITHWEGKRTKGTNFFKEKK